MGRKNRPPLPVPDPANDATRKKQIPFRQTLYPWVIFGNRALIDGWFEANRQVVTGRSWPERKRGAKSLGRPARRGLHAVRDAR